MINKFEQALDTVGHDLKVGAEDVVKAVVWLPAHLIKTERVIDTVIKDSPQVQADLKVLVGKVAAIDKLVAMDIAEKGLNIPDDLATLAAVKDLVSYVRGQFWADMGAAYTELQSVVS